MNMTNILSSMSFSQKLEIRVWSNTLEKYVSLWKGIMNDMPHELEKLEFVEFTANENYLVLNCKQ